MRTPSQRTFQVGELRQGENTIQNITNVRLREGGGASRGAVNMVPDSCGVSAVSLEGLFCV